MRKSKYVVALTILAASLLVNSVYALSWAVTDNAEAFGAQITIDSPKITYTFKLPNTSDSTCLAYTTQSVDVFYGQPIANNQIPSTSSFLGFNFVGWYSDLSFNSSVDLTSVYSESLTVYAKYQRTNVLSDGTNYYLSSNNDQTVSSRYIYKIDTQVWGTAPSLLNGNKIDLISNSGVYKMNYSSGWSIKRKIGIQGKNADSWWGNDSCNTCLFGQTQDTSNWDRIWWAGQISDGYAYINNSSSKTGFVYMEYSKTYIGAIRCANGRTIYLDSDETQYHPYNTTKVVSLTSGNKYSSTNLYLYLNGENNYPTWGNGN